MPFLSEQPTRAEFTQPLRFPSPDDMATDIALPEVRATSNRYELQDIIARGGMGAVYRAYDNVLQRAVAVKVIHEAIADERQKQRFTEEAIITGQLQHPSIPPVYDLGTLPDGRAFLAMKLIEGHTLESLIRKDCATLNVSSIFEAICQAIGYAHANRVIHRDLKPANIMVGAFGEVQVMDWGLAKQLDQPESIFDSMIAVSPVHLGDTPRTLAGTIMGTPAYMPPEQARGDLQRITERSDVFGLGGILCAMLTGQAPFPRGSADTVPQEKSRTKTLEFQERLDRCGAEPELIALAKHCLSNDPADRPANGNEVALIVAKQRKAAAEHAKSVLVATTATEARRRMWIGSAAAVFVVMALGIGVSTWQAFQATAAKKDAFRELSRAEQAERETAAQLERTHEQKVRAEAEERRAKESEARMAVATREATEFKVLAQGEAKRAKESEARMATANNETNNALTTMLNVFNDFDLRKTKARTEPLETVLAKRLVVAGQGLTTQTISDPVKLTNLQQQLGNILINLGQARDAIPLLTQARDLRGIHLGPDHSDTLLSVNCLARAYDEAGEVALALPLYEQSLNRLQATLGSNHEDTIRAMNHLGIGYLGLGRVDKALPHFEQSLTNVTAKFGPDHRETLACANNLAEAYRVAGQYDKAIQLIESTLERMKSNLRPDHPDRLTAMNNLAMIYQSDGQYDIAMPLFEEVFPLMKSKLGSDHPLTLVAMRNLAENYRGLGQWPKSFPIYEELLALSKAKLGADHTQTLIIVNNLAGIYRMDRQPAKAKMLFEQALAGLTPKLGADHPTVLHITTNLAATHRALGDMATAVPMFEDCLTRRRLKLGSAHPDTLQGLELVVMVYLDEYRDDRVLLLIDEFIRASRTKTYTNDANWAKVLSQSCGHLLRLKQYAAAETYLRECLTIHESLKTKTCEAYSAKSMLGAALLAQKKYAEAEPLIVAGYEGLKTGKVPTKSINSVYDAGQRMIDLYTATNRPEKAAAIRATLAKELAPAARIAKP